MFHMSSQPPSGFVQLVLFSHENPFYLEIPTAIIATLCLRPRKYLRYLGWCVLGVIGVLKDGQRNEIALDGELADQSIYHYIVPESINILAHAVDPEVIRRRSQVPSETTGTREDFRTQILERDGCCVWTGQEGVAMHIIPHRLGDEWIRVIIENWPHDENLDSLTINDIRNGIFAVDNLHNHYFDPRAVVVLKTPNPILETTDVPYRWQRDHIATDVSYPTNSRYTLQWIITPRNQFAQNMFPNNNDATFLNQRLPKPADLLLHYNYGAAAVKQWGRNINVLSDRSDVPRPPLSVPAPMGPARTTHDRKPSIAKRIAASAVQKGSSILHKIGNRSEEGAGDLEEQEEWDEDDVMLFFWGNSKAALERHAQRDQERTEYLEGWRAGVTGNPDVV